MQKKEMSPQEEKDAKEIERAVTAINGVLTETGTLLQPFIQHTEFGDFPRVRVVKKQEKVEEKEDVTKEINENSSDK